MRLFVSAIGSFGLNEMLTTGLDDINGVSQEEIEASVQAAYNRLREPKSQDIQEGVHETNNKKIEDLTQALNTARRLHPKRSNTRKNTTTRGFKF